MTTGINRIYNYIHQHPGCTVHELQHDLGIERATIHRALGELHDRHRCLVKGPMRRTVNPVTGRARKCTTYSLNTKTPWLYKAGQPKRVAEPVAPQSASVVDPVLRNMALSIGTVSLGMLIAAVITRYL